jgi:magnesium transporter
LPRSRKRSRRAACAARTAWWTRLAVDDLADLLSELPEAVTRQLLKSMDQGDRERVSSLLAYPEDTAGGPMNTDTVTVRAEVPMEVVLRHLRMRGELPEPTDRLFVVGFAALLGLGTLSLV